MARYDKYDGYVGGFRAPLAADWAPADIGKPYGVGLNSQGAIVKGAGNTGIRGVLVLTKVRKAGDIVDSMTQGEIVEWAPTAGAPGTDSGAAGTNYFSATDGVISSVGGAGKMYVGSTVEGSRLIVRVAGSAVV